MVHLKADVLVWIKFQADMWVKSGKGPSYYISFNQYIVIPCVINPAWNHEMSLEGPKARIVCTHLGDASLRMPYSYRILLLHAFYPLPEAYACFYLRLSTPPRHSLTGGWLEQVMTVHCHTVLEAHNPCTQYQKEILWHAWYISILILQIKRYNSLF